MAKRKMIQYNLLKNSISAYFAAIEIHNKPNIEYRYETTTFLLMNAWELALKSFIKKYCKKNSIFEKDGYTISLNKAIAIVEADINTKEPKSFTSIKENLILVEDYRNKVVHYYNEELEPYIFMLAAKSSLNYVEFVKKYFDKDILEDEGLFILPLGFKLPFKPEDFFTSQSANYINSKESKEFISSIVKVIHDLDKQDISDSIVVGFNIYLESVKKITNSDLIVAITSEETADVNFAKVTKYTPSNDPNVQKLNISDEGLVEMYPLAHKDVVDKCKKSIPGLKMNNEFHSVLRQLKENQKFAYTRKLDPTNKNSSVKTLYSQDIVAEIEKIYKANIT